MIRTTIRFKAYTLDRLDDAARRLGLSKNDLVELAVSKHLEKLANKTKKASNQAQ